MKTEAGTNRLVPIIEPIRNITLNCLKEAQILGSKYLFNVTNSQTHRDNIKLTYDKYSKRFNAAMKTLGLSSAHRPHDPRKTFVSLAKYYGVDEYTIKKVVGHKISDLTKAVYTTRPEVWLFKEIKKIKGIADLTT